jgi:hypothetical protein
MKKSANWLFIANSWRWWTKFIGPELRELLGVIRTQELIEARKIDGGEQFFSSANDFGF